MICFYFLGLGLGLGLGLVPRPSKFPRPAHITNDLAHLHQLPPVHQDPAAHIDQVFETVAGEEGAGGGAACAGAAVEVEVFVFSERLEFFEETRVGDIDVLRAGQSTRFEFHHRAHVHYDRLRIVFDALSKILAREVLVVRRAGEEGEEVVEHSCLVVSGWFRVSSFGFPVGRVFWVLGFLLVACGSGRCFLLLVPGVSRWVAPDLPSFSTFNVSTFNG